MFAPALLAKKSMMAIALHAVEEGRCIVKHLTHGKSAGTGSPVRCRS